MSRYIADGILEIGAQWIHGEEDNAVYKLASERNLTCDSTSFRGNLYVRSSGEIIDENLTSKLHRIYRTTMLEMDVDDDLGSFANSGELYCHL